MLWPTNKIHLVSGRNGAAREKTEAWLRDYAVPYDALHMREPGDRTANGRLKVKYINALRKQGLEPELFLEDWKEAADYIHEKTKVPVLLVNPAYDWIETPRNQMKSDSMGGGL